MSVPFPRPHRWYRQRLAALRAGLIETPEGQLMREHLEACSECREAFAVMGAGVSELQAADDHIPPEILARWERARTALRGLERAMVREHLARCAECRQDLELLGHVPELEIVPALEPPAAALAAAPAAERMAAPETSRAERAEAGDGETRRAGARSAGDAGAAEARGRVPRRMPAAGGPRAARAWIRWALGGWATAATAAAAFLIAVRPQPPVEEAVPLPGESATSPAPPAPGPETAAKPQPGAPAPRRPALESAAVIALGQDMRGAPAGDTLPLNEVRPDTRALVFGIPTEAMFDVPPGTAVRVELLDPSGQPAASAEFPMRRLLADRALVLRLEAEGISAGVYRLRLAPRGHEPVEARFRVRVVEDR